MATATAIATELRARLATRHDALRSMGWLDDDSDMGPAWWRADASSTDCWWLSGETETRNDDIPVPILEGAEALALLRALAQIDHEAFVDEVHGVWRCEGESITAPTNAATVPESHCEIGLMYEINKITDIEAVCERVDGVQRPCDDFIDDFTWLQNVFSSLNVGQVPVRIVIDLDYEDDDGGNQLAFILSQLVESTLAQLHDNQKHHLDAQQNELVEAATASVMFKVVEVDVDEVGWASADMQAIEHLAMLSRLGVHVKRLPAIGGYVTSIQDMFGAERLSRNKRISVARSLQQLVLRSPHTEYAQVTDDVSQRLIPAIFSAIQASRSVKQVTLEASWERHDDRLRDEGSTYDTLWWGWAAYTLFSRHANTSVERVTLDVAHMRDHALRAIVQVLQAENPLAVVLDTTVLHQQWLTASRFYVERPRDNDDIRHEPVLVTRESLRVRVVGSFTSGTIEWWHVLLPGCGNAWVTARDATELTPDADDGSISSTATYGSRGRPLHLTLCDCHAGTVDLALAFLRLVHRDLCSIDMKENRGGSTFDVTEFTVEALRLFPTLEKLKYPKLAAIPRLGILVDAAETSIFRLRTLSLSQHLRLDATDILTFLNVLSDTSHPLTKRLEELEFAVCTPDEAAKSLFEAAWRRVLDNNRTLHTISLLLIGPDSLETLDTSADNVAIRTDPLCLTRKLSFLSVVIDRASMCAELDADVVALIFALAAPHRLRTIKMVVKRD